MTHRPGHAPDPDAGRGRAGRPAGGAAGLLRRRRPGRHHRGEGARPVRRARLRPQADRAQQARRRRPRVARRDLRRGARRGARRARPWCSPPTASRRRCTGRPTSAALKTIDATCPLVTKVHHEAKRFAGEDYDILLIGHEGHEEVEGTAGEAPDHIQLVQSPADVPGIVVRDPAQGRLALADHALGRRDPGDRGRDPRAVPDCCSTRPATTSATPPRTASSRSRRSPRTPTW